MPFYTLRGNTLQATAQFQDGNGNVIDVENVNMYVYNNNRVKIDTVSPIYIAGEQKYEALYVFDDEGDYYVEFNASLDGNPVLNREKVVVRFATR